MLLPNDTLCALIIEEMLTMPNQLTAWELEFAESNRRRVEFTDRQKEKVFALLIEKYQFDCMRGYQ